MKTIAIIFSDLHLNDYTKFNQDNKRTLSHFKVLFYLRQLAIKKACPVLFLGDLFHRPEVISNNFYDIITENFKLLDEKDWDMYAISGNHDCSQQNNKNHSSPSWVRSFSKQYKFLKCVDFKTIKLKKHGYTISGIPYLDHNVHLNELVKEIEPANRHILMLHTDYPGACDTDGQEVGSSENININLLNKFKLTVIGHIHKPQRLSKKVYMIGAPLQQRRSDRDCALGYWQLYDDWTMKFVELKGFPRFIDVESEDEIMNDGNYYTIKAKVSEEDKETSATNSGITKNLSKVKLAKTYLKHKGIKDDDKKKLLIKTLKSTGNDTI